MRVREASLDDWPAVAALLDELGRPDVRDDGAYRERFAAYLARPDTSALVAEDDDGALVGFVDLEFRERLAYATPQAWVPDLIVAEKHRSRGAGAALLARAEELARGRGCWSITLESAIWREDAHRFYVREGWTDAAKSFGKKL